jgi:hypothetical protein
MTNINIHFINTNNNIYSIVKYLKIFENFNNIKLSDYMKNYGHDSLFDLTKYKQLIPSVLDYVTNDLQLKIYHINPDGMLNFNKLYYFLLVDQNNNSVDITIITNDEKKTIDINMINSSTPGIKLGKRIIEKIKEYADMDDYTIRVSNVTNYKFWANLGFKEHNYGKMFLRYDNKK